MKAPLLIQIEGRVRTVHAFPNRTAYLAHIERAEARAKAKGLKAETLAATHQARKTDVLIIYRSNQPAPLPSRQQVAAILKQYKEGAQ